MKKLHLTLSQKIQVHEMYSRCLEQYNGHWRFKSNSECKSDEDVAANLKVPVRLAQAIRRELFGKLESSSYNAGGLDVLKEDLKAVMDYLTRVNPMWREE